jgi:hypothetical protein
MNVIDVSGRIQGMPGYAMASGVTQGNLASARGDLATLQDQRLVLANLLQKAQDAINANENKYKVAAQGWNACKTSDCKSHHTASRCSACRTPFNTAMAAAENARPALASTRSNAASNLSQKDGQIATVQATIAGLLASIEAENQAEQTLAGQGMTSESIVADAQAKATAEVERARLEAESKASGIKMRNRVIALIVIAAVAIGVIFMVRKIRSKRKGKK